MKGRAVIFASAAPRLVLGAPWLHGHLDDTVRALLSEPWVLDCDTTIKPLHGRQEGTVVNYNPKKPGRPSHA